MRKYTAKTVIFILLICVSICRQCWGTVYFPAGAYYQKNKIDNINILTKRQEQIQIDIEEYKSRIDTCVSDILVSKEELENENITSDKKATLEYNIKECEYTLFKTQKMMEVLEIELAQIEKELKYWRLK